MKLRPLLPVTLALVFGHASAITVSGTVNGTLTSDTRIGGFTVTPFGQPVDEVGSVTVSGDKFRIELPSAAPSAKAQVKLTAQNVSWPGVLDPVTVSSGVQAAELKLFSYRDLNGNARRDDSEPVREVVPNVGKATLFMAWVSGDVTVRANKGYEATLKSGWNAFIVDVGKAVKVQPFQDGTVVNVRLGR